MSTILLHMVWPQCKFRMQVWNVLHECGSLEIQDAKIRHLSTIAQLCRTLRNQGTYWQSEKNLLNSISPTCPHNMVNFGRLTAEICWRVWGTPANFNGFHVLVALLHGTLLVGVSQTLRRWTEDATCLAGRPSRWALAHILVSNIFLSATAL